MNELQKLKAKIKRLQERLEVARMAFDLEGIEYLQEEINELQQFVAAMEGAE